MPNIRVILKPGGIAALVLLSAATVTASIVGIRGRLTPGVASAPVGAVKAVAKKPALPTEMSPQELGDKDLLKKLNADPKQAREWLFLGPLQSGNAIQNLSNNKDDEARMRQIIYTSYLPTEAKYQGREDSPVKLGNVEYRWHKVKGSGFDFKGMFTSKETPFESLQNVVVYGYTTIDSPRTAKKRLHFRSDDGALVWLNGELVHKIEKIRGVENEDLVNLKLRPGKNNVLVKVAQGGGGWGMSFQLEDAR